MVRASTLTLFINAFVCLCVRESELGGKGKRDQRASFPSAFITLLPKYVIDNLSEARSLGFLGCP